MAQWFKTYEPTARVPEISGLPDESAGRLRSLLSGDGTQAAIQELLAVYYDDEISALVGRLAGTTALSLDGGLLPLLQDIPLNMFQLSSSAFLMNQFYELSHGWPETTGLPEKQIRILRQTGEFLTGSWRLPLITGLPASWTSLPWADHFKDWAEGKVSFTARPVSHIFASCDQ